MAFRAQSSVKLIVQRRGASLLLIRQPDHAALSARVMERWRADGFPCSPARADVLYAIEEHDNGWLEPDAAPLVHDSTGRIADFMSAPDAVKRAVWPRGVARLAHAPYAAALVAQHALHVFRRYRTDADWAEFFAEMEGARAFAASKCGGSGPAGRTRTLDDVQRDYAFLRIGDLISLTFCNGWTDPQKDDAGSGYEIRLEGTRVIVTPDPFVGRQVPFSVTARELRDRPFRSAADAQEEWSAARSVLLEGIATGG